MQTKLLMAFGKQTDWKQMPFCNQLITTLLETCIKVSFICKKKKSGSMTSPGLTLEAGLNAAAHIIYNATIQAKLLYPESTVTSYGMTSTLSTSPFQIPCWSVLLSRLHPSPFRVSSR